MLRDTSYQFLGFNPDDRIKQFVARMVNDLYLAAPSDSGVKLVVEKCGDLLKASCRIASQVGVFTSEVTGKNALGLLADLEEKMNDHLKQWKKTRFLPQQAYRNPDIVLAS